VRGWDVDDVDDRDKTGRIQLASGGEGRIYVYVKEKRERSQEGSAFGVISEINGEGAAIKDDTREGRMKLYSVGIFLFPDPLSFRASHPDVVAFSLRTPSAEQRTSQGSRATANGTQQACRRTTPTDRLPWMVIKGAPDMAS